MKAYADSSFLVAAYWFAERDSVRATEWLQRQRQPLAFTPLHRHEVHTAIRQKVFRGHATSEECKQALQEIDSDLKDAILNHIPIPWTDAFREGELIGSAQAERVAIRSFDLLHLGIAKALKAERFLTFDLAQRELARLVGFEVGF
jgi:predicted nucleic acid-binding protein